MQRLSEVERRWCREFWRQCSPRQRRKLTTLSCSASILYLNVAEKLLTTRSSKAEAAAARKEFHLVDLEWRLEHPRRLLLGAELCRSDAGMDFIVSFCDQTLEEVLELVQQARSDRIDFDADTSRLVSGRSETWAAHARDFWAIVVHDLLAHLQEDTERLKLVNAVLTRPPPSSRRSWPPRQAFAELKAGWEKLAPEDRANMTVLSSSEFWLVQACDVAIASAVLLSLDRQGFAVDANDLVKALRRQCKVTSNLEVRFDPVPRLMLSAAFVAQPDCLDEVYKRAVWHGHEKAAILRTALCYRFEELCRSEENVAADPSCTWADMERLVATLILEALLFRQGMLGKAERFLEREQEAERRLLEAAAAQKQQKRQDKRQAARERRAAEAAALALAERERRLAEEERRLAEEERRAAETRREAAEACRAAQEEVRVDAEVRRRLEEERRVWERRQEKERIRKLLATAPSLDADVSCLQISQTFLTFLPGPALAFSRYNEW